MFVLYFIIEPQIKVYLIDGNHFTTNINEAKKISDIKAAYKEQLKYPFNVQIERVGG